MQRYWPEDVGDVLKTKSFKIQRSETGENHVTNSLLVTDLEICYHGDLKVSKEYICLFVYKFSAFVKILGYSEWGGAKNRAIFFMAQLNLASMGNPSI